MSPCLTGKCAETKLVAINHDPLRRRHQSAPGVCRGGRPYPPSSYSNGGLGTPNWRGILHGNPGNRRHRLCRSQHRQGTGGPRPRRGQLGRHASGLTDTAVFGRTDLPGHLRHRRHSGHGRPRNAADGPLHRPGGSRRRIHREPHRSGNRPQQGHPGYQPHRHRQPAGTDAVGPACGGSSTSARAQPTA